MQALGFVLMARILFATLVLNQISSQAVERRLETIDLSDASQSLTKTSLEAKALMGTQQSNGLGALVGARFSKFVMPNLFLGAGGYGGRLLGSGVGAESLGYGGLLAGGEIPLGSTFFLEGTTLIGLGGAKYNTAAGPREGSSLVIEPQVALIARLAKGTRVGVQTSYVSFSSLNELSGWSVSVFIDFRRFSLSIPD
jgi:hypothetical protein